MKLRWLQLIRSGCSGITRIQVNQITHYYAAREDHPDNSGTVICLTSGVVLNVKSTPEEIDRGLETFKGRRFKCLS